MIRRERGEPVVIHPDMVLICAEASRAVEGLDIAGVIDNTPGKVDVNGWKQLI
jgi:hypothetical protein